MLDDYKETQKVLYKILKNSIEKNRTSHAYLFEANDCNYVNDLALAFSKALLCPKNFTNSKQCENCKQCENIDKNCFIEFKIIKPDGQWIKKEQLDELQKEFSMKSIASTKKVYIIDHAEMLNVSSANTILKFLEEPAPNIVAILITNNIYQILPTIKSRCQIVSLKKNKIDNNTLFDSLKSEEFKSEEELKDFIILIINFIKFIEANKKDAILYTQHKWHEYVNGKELYNLAFDIMTLYYKDVLNYKVNRPLMYFQEEQIKDIALKNDLDKINKKLQIVISLKEKIKYNLNLNLIMDRFIIEVSEV